MNRDELVQRIREAADMVGSDFVSNAELDGWIDTSIRSLYWLLVDKYGAEYFSASTWLQVRPGTDPNVGWPRLTLNPESEYPSPDLGYSSAYALPDNFERIIRVQFLAGTVSRTVVEAGHETEHEARRTESWQLNTLERTAYPMHSIETVGQAMCFDPIDWRQTRVGYRIRRGPARVFALNTYDNGVPVYTVLEHLGSVIDFLPVPNGNYAVQVTYAQTPSLLPNHPHIEYVISDCAAQCLEKQQSDSGALRARQALEGQLIEQGSARPSNARPRQIQRIHGANRIDGVTGRWGARY
jgi:hypothetical protein